MAGGPMGVHEFGHTIQFWGLSLAESVAPDTPLAWVFGAYGIINLPGIFNSKHILETGVSHLGGIF